VGVFFVGIQLLLLVCFVLKLIDLSTRMTWVGVVDVICGVFVLPFRLLLQNIAVAISMAFEIYTLLAIPSVWLALASTGTFFEGPAGFALSEV